MRALVLPIRENEFHLLKRIGSPSCPFVSIDVEGARRESWPASGTSTKAAARAQSFVGGTVARQHGSERGQSGRHQHHAGRAQEVQQRDEDEASERGAGQIGGMHHVDPRGQPTDGEREDEAPVKNGTAARA